jgi:hypothetical protein
MDARRPRLIPHGAPQSLPLRSTACQQELSARAGPDARPRGQQQVEPLLPRQAAGVDDEGTTGNPEPSAHLRGARPPGGMETLEIDAEGSESVRVPWGNEAAASSGLFPSPGLDEAGGHRSTST